MINLAHDLEISRCDTTNQPWIIFNQDKEIKKIGQMCRYEQVAGNAKREDPDDQQSCSCLQINFVCF